MSLALLPLWRQVMLSLPYPIPHLLPGRFLCRAHGTCRRILCLTDSHVRRIDHRRAQSSAVWNGATASECRAHRRGACATGARNKAPARWLFRPDDPPLLETLPAVTWTAFVSAPAFVFEFLCAAIALSLFPLPAISQPRRRIASCFAPYDLPRWYARHALRLLAVVYRGASRSRAGNRCQESRLHGGCRTALYTYRAYSRAHAMGVYGDVRFCGGPRQPHLPRRNPGAGPEPAFRNPDCTADAGPPYIHIARILARTRWGCTVVSGVGTAPCETMSRLRSRRNPVGG